MKKMEAVDIRIEKTSFSGRHLIFRNLNLSLGAGLNIIFGPPGRGKTLLMQVLAGLEEPEEGSIKWDGKISMVSQYPEREFLYSDCFSELGGSGCGCPSSHLFSLSDIGLSSRILPLSPWSLSRGEKKRLAILRALREYPRQERALIIDDPFCDLDIGGRKAVVDMIKKLLKEIIIISTNRKEDLKYIETRNTVCNIIEI